MENAIELNAENAASVIPKLNTGDVVKIMFENTAYFLRYGTWTTKIQDSMLSEGFFTTLASKVGEYGAAMERGDSPDYRKLIKHLRVLRDAGKDGEWIVTSGSVVCSKQKFIELIETGNYFIG